MPEPTSPFIFAGGLDYTNAYFHRGYLQQGGGAVLQPYATVARMWKPNDEWIVRPYLTSWNSTGGWNNESDRPMGAFLSELMGGIYATRGPLALDVYYNLYFYPSMGFAQEGGGKATYDVATLWRPPSDDTLFTLKPYTALYYGSLNQIGMGKGYFETGIEPAWRLGIGTHKVGISFPTYLGTNVDDYYSRSDGRSEFLGFFAAGVSASTALPAPRGCGSWFLNGSVQYLHLIADNIAALNHGDRDPVVVKIGIGVLY